LVFAARRRGSSKNLQKRRLMLLDDVIKELVNNEIKHWREEQGK